MPKASQKLSCGPVSRIYIKQAQTAAMAPYAKLFADALDKAGQNLTRDSLRSALDTGFSNYDTGFGPSLTWTPDHHGGVSDFMFFQIKNGQLTPVSDFIKGSSVWP
jgi:branched-chain amino acid transport system substrate-binding protein